MPETLKDFLHFVQTTVFSIRASTLGSLRTLLACPKQLFNRPNVIGQTCLHRGSHAQSLMHAAEIIPSHVNRNGGFQIVQALAEP